MKRIVRSRRGSAMVGALFVVVAVAVLSVAYLQLSLSKNREGRSSVDAKRAFYMAEAGLSEAFTAIRMGRSGNVGTAEEPAQFANGVFWVEATQQDDNTVLLRSTGLCGSGRSSLSVVVDKSESSVPALGVFGDEDVTIGEGALIDSYDSGLGPYGDQGYDPEWYERVRTTGDGGLIDLDIGGDSGGSGGSGGGASIEIGCAETLGGGSGDPLLGMGAAAGAALGGGLLLAPQITIDLDEGGLTVTTTDDAAQNNYTLDQWADTIHEMQDIDRLPRSAKVSCNGDVTIHGAQPGQRPTRILGDVRPGPESSVNSESGTLITGGTAPMDAHVVLPPIEVPALEDRGDLTVGVRSSPRVVQDEEGSYGTLRALAGATLVLRGPMKLVVDELVVEPGATLRLDASDGPIEVFTTGYFGLEDGSIVQSLTEVPADVTFIVTADEWIDRDGDGEEDSPAVLSPTGQLHAVVYAPEADLQIDPDLRLFGSVAARRLELLPNARVHFDVALEHLPGGLLAIPRLGAWRIVELPDAPIVRSRMEPLKWLKLRSIAVPLAKDAYIDKWLDIDYLCADGHSHRYRGPEHLFDPSRVASVLSQTLSAVGSNGCMNEPEDDFFKAALGHVAQKLRSPFVIVP